MQSTAYRPWVESRGYSMGNSTGNFLPNNGERDDTQRPLAPVPDVLAKIFHDLPSYGELNDEARDYLRDNIELGLEHLAGACIAWGSGAYFPCEASCRTVFEISVNILYIAFLFNSWKFSYN